MSAAPGGQGAFETKHPTPSNQSPNRALVAALVAVAGGYAIGLGPGAESDSGSPDGDRLVKATLVMDQSAIVPGSEGTLGVRLVVEPKWHIYWRNNGDSGMPVSIEFEEMPGLTIGECQWPAPQRHVSDGDLLDFVHEGEVVLLFAYRADASLTPGTTLTLAGTASWLVCQELCVPGDGGISLSVPVAAAATPGESGALIERARGELPRAPRAGEMAARWDAETLELRVDGATRLVFFPYESDDGVTPSDLLTKGDVKGDSIRLHYPEQVRRAAHVRGVLEVWRDSARHHLLVDTEGPGPR